MFTTEDTIVAVATPPGRGALGVVRLSGSDALRIAGELLAGHPALPPRRATLARVAGADGAGPIDEVIATFFPGPASYTGEDVVEISGHGSPVVLRAVVARTMAAGARLAERGEFTLRAFLNGRIDLVQAEAVADLVDAVTPLQARAAFDQLRGTLTSAVQGIEREVFGLAARLEAAVDFPEERDEFVGPGAAAAEIDACASRIDELLCQARRGRVVREGCQVTIVGTTNTGKSSLFNKLTGLDRAIVTALEGTTRDLLTETVEIGGVPVDLVDSAGVRESQDVIEREGVCRARRATAAADLVLLVLDGSRPLETGDRALLVETRGKQRVVVVNKRDLEAAWSEEALEEEAGRVVRTSARTGEGLTELREAIAERLVGEVAWEPPPVTNARHVALLEEARGAMARAARTARAGGRTGSEEFVLADLREARAALEGITGERTTEELLDEIFSRFCIGK